MIGWLTLEFVGRPFRRFYDLRGEIISRLVQFSNVSPRWKEIPDDVGAVSGNREELPLSEEAIERLHEAENVLRDLASQLRAFALSFSGTIRSRLAVVFLAYPTPSIPMAVEETFTEKRSLKPCAST